MSSGKLIGLALLICGVVIVKLASPEERVE